MSSIEQIKKKILEKKRLKQLQAQAASQLVSVLPSNATATVHQYNLRSHPVESQTSQVNRQVDLQNKNKATEEVQQKPKQTDEMQLLLARIHKKKPTSNSNLDVPTEGPVHVPMIDQEKHATSQISPSAQEVVSNREYLQEQRMEKYLNTDPLGMDPPIQTELTSAGKGQNGELAYGHVQEGNPSIAQQASLSSNLDQDSNSQQIQLTQQQHIIPDQQSHESNREKSSFEQKMKNLEQSGWQIPKLSHQQPSERTGNTHSLHTLISGLQYLIQGIPVQSEGVATRSLSENTRILSDLVDFRS